MAIAFSSAAVRATLGALGAATVLGCAGAQAAPVTGPSTTPAVPAPSPLPPPDVHGFDAFCDVWMQKLRDRETYNVAHIVWERQADRVVGEHVSYGTERTCVARAEDGKDPIGKITYREIRYRREGTTPEEALAAPGTIVEHSDVTEIFRFAKGRWQY